MGITPAGRSAGGLGSIVPPRCRAHRGARRDGLRSWERPGASLGRYRGRSAGEQHVHSRRRASDSAGGVCRDMQVGVQSGRPSGFSSASLALVLVLAASGIPGSFAQAQPSLSNEQLVRIPVTVRELFGSKQVMLEGTTYRPSGKGPFPLAVLNHGGPRSAGDHRIRTRERYPQQSAWFLARGFAVVIPMRRGYAGSEGDWAEGGGPCARKDWLLTASRVSQGHPCGR